MKHFVVGVDGSTSSEMAVHWAAAVASASGAEITVVRVLDHVSNRHGAEGLDLTDSYQAEAGDANGLKHDVKLLHGEATTEILAIAAEVGADMIVIGRRERRLVGPRLLGSFTRQLLQKNEIPVAIVPGPSEQLPRTDLVATAVVGLDATESAEAVFNCALSLCQASGLAMDLLTAVDIHDDGAMNSGRSQRLDIASAEHLSLRLVSTVDPHTRQRITPRAVVGVPSEELLRGSQHAELLVVGHRRRSPLGQFLAHATGRYCAAHSACPVVMVPIEPPPAAPSGFSG